MTPIFFLTFYFIGIGLTIFRHPIFGLYTYLFTFYMAPDSGWWRGAVPDLRYTLVAGIVTLACCLRLPADADRSKWHQTGAARLLLLFVAWNWAQTFWAVDRDLQIEGAVLYSKHLISFYLFYRLANSVKEIRNVAFAHVLGCMWFGYQALGAGGGRLESIGGAVAGANELGVHIATGILFGGILLMTIDGLRRWIILAAMPLIVNCLVLTLSRGSILGLIGGGLAGYFYIPRKLKKKYALFGLLGLALFGLVAHEPLIERVRETYAGLTGQEQLDSSAANRTEIARAGLRIAMDYPLGAGHRSTAILSSQYMDQSLLDRNGVRAAHNTLVAIIAEHGFPGIVMYLLTILWVFRTMFSISRPHGQLDTSTLQGMATFAAGSVIAIYVSGNFSNNIDLETQYWCLALLASVFELHKSAIRTGVRSETIEPAAPLQRSAPRA